MSLDQEMLIGTLVACQSTKVNKKNDSKSSIWDRLKEFAFSVPDFRRTSKGNNRHILGDIIILIILGRLSSCVYRADIIEFGKHNLHKLRKLGLLKNGVPSEATLCRVDKGIDDDQMADKMQQFAELFNSELHKPKYSKEIICIDGKATRGTVLSNGRNPDIVSAYSYYTNITLATVVCQEKSNEIKAVPILLDKIDIAGKIVTADAMSMQKDIVDKIRAKGCDFLIELKANQRSLCYGIEDYIKTHEPLYSYQDEVELNHGRIETRFYKVYNGIDMIADKEKWGGALTIVECECITIIKSTNVQTCDKRLYATNLPTKTTCLGFIIRAHWAIENNCHWNLDRNIKQDMIKRKTLKAARNLDTLQRIVLSIIYIWKGLRKKITDKCTGPANILRHISMSFTNLMHFLTQK